MEHQIVRIAASALLAARRVVPRISGHTGWGIKLLRLRGQLGSSKSGLLRRLFENGTHSKRLAGLTFMCVGLLHVELNTSEILFASLDPVVLIVGSAVLWQ